MSRPAYYNEFNKYAADWLRNLIDAGLIAPGVVDERSIEDVHPSDLEGFTQCHFFAGVGIWSLALRRAGWPDSRPVWTGSCPCQPFSVSGKKAGFADERHLWPAWHWLIEKRRPPTILGEQVAAASDWLRLVRGDMEALGYSVGAVPIEAASAGADHFRDRLWFVAHDDQQRTGTRRLQRGGKQRRTSGAAQHHAGSLAHLSGQRGDRVEGAPESNGRPGSQVRGDCALVNHPSLGWGEGWTEHEFRSRGFTAAVASIDGCQYVECPDGKWRRLPPPRVRWLGHGIPARVDKLRAIGNAIDPRPAQAFIECVTDLLQQHGGYSHDRT